MTRFSFRTDQVETLQATLEYVIGRHNWALGSSYPRKDVPQIDRLANKVCRARLQEILDQLAGTV